MGFYALGGFEDNVNQRTLLKRYFANDIAKRRNYINVWTARAKASDPRLPSLLQSTLPDYALMYAIPILTHHPKFTSYVNVDDLRRIELCLWFILEPLVLKNEHFSFGFYKTLLDKIKNHTTGLQIAEQDNVRLTLC